MTTKLEKAYKQLEKAQAESIQAMRDGDQAALDAATDKAVKAFAVIAASKMGAKGGSSTSDAKRAASAANGKRGGRPRKSA